MCYLGTMNKLEKYEQLGDLSLLNRCWLPSKTTKFLFDSSSSVGRSWQLNTLTIKNKKLYNTWSYCG